MDSHGRKMVAPIVVSVLLITYYILYFRLIQTMLDGVVRYAFGLIPLAMAALMVKVCVERIKEIRSGEEDDIGKY